MLRNYSIRAQQVDAINHQQPDLHYIQRNGGEVGAFQRQVMKPMHDSRIQMVFVRRNNTKANPVF